MKGQLNPIYWRIIRQEKGVLGYRHTQFGWQVHSMPDLTIEQTIEAKIECITLFGGGCDIRGLKNHARYADLMHVLNNQPTQVDQSQCVFVPDEPVAFIPSKELESAISTTSSTGGDLLVADEAEEEAYA